MASLLASSRCARRQIIGRTATGHGHATCYCAVGNNYSGADAQAHGGHSAAGCFKSNEATARTGGDDTTPRFLDDYSIGRGPTPEYNNSAAHNRTTSAIHTRAHACSASFRDPALSGAASAL